MLRSHPVELESDLWDRGIDLVSMYRGDVSVRRVALLAASLPPSSRVSMVMQTDDMWSPTDYLIADLRDSVQNLIWVSANKGVEKSKQTEQPKPTLRPADFRKKEQQDDERLRKAKAFKRRLRERGE